MRTILQITRFHDRRTPELMRHSDSIDEKRWHVRVRLNSNELRRGLPAVAVIREPRPAGPLSFLGRRQAS
jgi:hypothetical protein